MCSADVCRQTSTSEKFLAAEGVGEREVMNGDRNDTLMADGGEKQFFHGKTVARTKRQCRIRFFHAVWGYQHTRSFSCEQVSAYLRLSLISRGVFRIVFALG